MLPMSPMSMSPVLYALSTFAQTCAALVGAVGLFKLQLLSVERERLLHTIGGRLPNAALVSGSEVQNMPEADLIQLARTNSQEGTGIHSAETRTHGRRAWDVSVSPGPTAADHSFRRDPNTFRRSIHIDGRSS